MAKTATAMTGFARVLGSWFLVLGSESVLGAWELVLGADNGVLGEN